ncbi:MAG TPA: DUF881 domain-containing protein [Nocardioidaceae bacterium]|nr:DUF881 domain-containing protein [Nocardioidaceae bacterium]
MIARPPFDKRSRADRRTTSSWDLLEQVSATSLDEDYGRVATRRGAQGKGSRPRPRMLAAVALIALGVLIAVTTLQTRSASPVDAQERSSLVSQIHDREADISRLANRNDRLQTEVGNLQSSAEQLGGKGDALLDALNQARLLTGAIPATGPGLRIVADDEANGEAGSGGTILDVDLQVMVNGLWQAGAEAISINGNRLGSLSAIRTAGRAITVNYNSLIPPYVVTAIGDPDTLEAAFAETPGGQAWFDLETNYGIQFDMDTVDQLTLPAVPSERLDTQYAQRPSEKP